MDFRNWLNEALRRFGNQGEVGPLRRISIQPIDKVAVLRAALKDLEVGAMKDAADKVIEATGDNLVSQEISRRNPGQIERYKELINQLIWTLGDHPNLSMKR